jgi:hypothetical protein
MVVDCLCRKGFTKEATEYLDIAKQIQVPVGIF